MDGSAWQEGPSYLLLLREQWPLSREFLDCLPIEELRSPRAAFSVASMESYVSILGSKLDGIVKQVMGSSNCRMKTTRVTARLLKGHFGGRRSRISEPLVVADITVAEKVQLIASMGPNLEAMEKGYLAPLRPKLEGGIMYMRDRFDRSLMELLGIGQLPILARQIRLAELIMIEAHCEDHRSTASDVLARSRRRAWIIRGRYLAKQVTKNSPCCKLNNRKLVEQIMSDIPSHQLFPCPLFSHVSLDFAGPFMARAMGNSRTQVKGWGLVVVCQNMRAVKMYATDGYATNDFLTAYTRFTANQGNPLLVVSDSGSQLTKAAKLVDQFDLTKLDRTKIRQGAGRNGTE